MAVLRDQAARARGVIAKISNRLLGRKTRRAPGARNPPSPGRSIDEIADTLRACRTDRDFVKMHRTAAGMLTPLEAAALIEFSHRLLPPTQAWLEDLARTGGFGGVAPQRHYRRPVAENIDFYSDPFVPTAEKNLVIAFSGAANRMMIATPVLLQFLPSDRFDLVLLRDPTKLDYAFAIPPYAHNFRDLVLRLAADIGLENYRRLYCFGTSMGGFPALRCGILIKANKAIAVGGHFPLYPPKYWMDQKFDIPAFDLLCACHAQTATTLICCYSANYDNDARSAAVLARMYPIRHITVASAQHNFFAALQPPQRLKQFIESLFAEDPRQGLTEPDLMIERVA
jgi:hypothetical protein